MCLLVIEAIGHAIPAAAGAPESQAANQSSGVPGPQIQFVSTVFNFGRIKFGHVVRHDFVFRNTGTGMLEVLDVEVGCGCTTAAAWDKQVQPGKTGRIPLQFNSTGFTGAVNKSVAVACNDPRRSNVVLQITGTVWKPIDVSPTLALFNYLAEGQTNDTKVIRIISHLEEPLTLSELRSTNKSFSAALKSLKPGKEFELRVTAIPPFTNPTTYSYITLKTSSSEATNIAVTAYAVVQQPVTVSPPQLTVPAGPLKTPLSLGVLVRNNTTNSLEVSDVRFNLPDVAVKVAQPQTGRLYSITLTFPAGFEAAAGQSMELAIKTSHLEYPEIKVSVIQMKALSVPPGAEPPSAATKLGRASPP